MSAPVVLANFTGHVVADWNPVRVDLAIPQSNAVSVTKRRKKKIIDSP